MTKLDSTNLTRTKDYALDIDYEMLSKSNRILLGNFILSNY